MTGNILLSVANKLTRCLAAASRSENAATATQPGSLGGFGLLAAVSAAPATRVFK